MLGVGFALGIALSIFCNRYDVLQVDILHGRFAGWVLSPYRSPADTGESRPEPSDVTGSYNVLLDDHVRFTNVMSMGPAEFIDRLESHLERGQGDALDLDVWISNASEPASIRISGMNTGRQR